MDIKINYFSETLKLSEQYNDLLNEFYFRITKNINDIKVVSFEDDQDLQKLGVDKIFIINNQPKYVEEKLRFGNYTDIFIEDKMNMELNHYGWIHGEKKTDFLMYYIIKTNLLYVINFKSLQKFYLKNRIKLLQFYGLKYSKNKNYTSSGVVIPFEDLKRFLGVKNVKKYKL